MKKLHVAMVVIIFTISLFLIPLPVTEDKKEITFPDETINSSTDQIITTDYNINYRMVSYKQVKQYNAGNNPAISGAEDVIGIVRFEGLTSPTPPSYPGSYRCIVLRNGTIYLFNVSHYTDPGILNEARLLPGYGYQDGLEMEYVMKWNYDVSELEPQIAVQSLYGYGVIIFGKNSTTSAISLFSIDYDGTTFHYSYNYTLVKPALFASINDVHINDARYDGGYLIGGKFVDGSTNVPFAYKLNSTLGVDVDFTNLTTSTTDYQAFDDCVVSVQASWFGITIISHYILTNKRVITISPGGTTIYENIEFPNEITYSSIPTYVKVSNIFTFNASYAESLSWGYLSTGGIEVFYLKSNMYYNWTSFTYYTITTIQQDPNVALLTQQIEPDNIFKSSVDFADGQIFYGMDTRFKVWQTWNVRSGSVSVIWFDWYIPYKIIKYDDVNPALEVWYGDSRGIWVAQFNGDIINVLEYGNSSVSHIISQRVDISHKQSTDSFQFTISGYLERKSNDICEVGIIPLIGVGLGDLYDPNPKLFTVNKQYTFTNIQEGGVVLRPKINFQGSGSKIIEFYVSFDADFCPYIKNFFGVNYVAFSMYALAWERYNNGTYTQKLLYGGFTAKSSLYMYSFALETGLSIQDSHMLDELHFFSNSLEYSPYNVFFTTPNASILVTDKVTNDTLFSGYMHFRDPLVLPIPAKYEFFIKTFSTLDQFGIDTGLFNIFVNNTEITTDNVRILSPNANIVFRDFANYVLKNVTISKNLNGSYIKVGLDVAQKIISNQYNYTINFYLTRGSTTIYYQLPGQTSIILRLGLGLYHYKVTDESGRTLVDKDITLSTAKTISIGVFTTTFPEFPSVQGITVLDLITGLIISVGILIILVFIAYKISGTSTTPGVHLSSSNNAKNIKNAKGGKKVAHSSPRKKIGFL